MMVLLQAIDLKMFFIKDLFESEGFVNKMKDYANEFNQNPAILGIVVLALGMAVLWEWIQVSLKKDHAFNWMEIARLFFLLFLFVNYNAMMAIPNGIMNGLVKLTDNINSEFIAAQHKGLAGDATDLMLEQHQNYTRDSADIDMLAYLDGMKDEMNHPEKKQAEDEEGVLEWMGNQVALGVWQAFTAVTTTMGFGSLILLSKVVKVVIYIFIITIRWTLYIGGLLTIMFSIIPFFKKAVGFWFNVYFGLFIWEIAFNLIDAVLYVGMANSWYPQANIIIMSSLLIGTIVLYIVIPIVAGWLGFKTDASSAISTAMTLAFVAAGGLKGIGMNPASTGVDAATSMSSDFKK